MQQKKSSGDGDDSNGVMLAFLRKTEEKPQKTFHKIYMHLFIGVSTIPKERIWKRNAYLNKQIN